MPKKSKKPRKSPKKPAAKASPKTGGINTAALAVFEKRAADLLVQAFQAGRLESLFAIIKAYAKDFSPGSFYRLAAVSKVHRTYDGGSDVEWANLVGQIALSPQRQDGPHELSFGAFTHAAFKPCPACRGDGAASSEEAPAGLPEFLPALEEELHNALWLILEEGGLWEQLRALRESKTPVAGPDYTYLLNFRAEYITRDKESELLTPKRLTVIAAISFPFTPSTAKKAPPALEPKPGMLSARACADCGGSGFSISTK